MRLFVAAFLACISFAADKAAITVRCYDWVTADPLAGREVKVFSDNGVRCVKTPCDTGGRQWTGKIDQSGAAAIPADVLQQVHTISIAGYEPMTLRRPLKSGERLVFRKERRTSKR